MPALPEVAVTRQKSIVYLSRTTSKALLPPNSMSKVDAKSSAKHLPPFSPQGRISNAVIAQAHRLQFWPCLFTKEDVISVEVSTSSGVDSRLRWQICEVEHAALAWRIDPESPRASKQQQLRCFFPTKARNPFRNLLVHGGFKVSSNRNEIKAAEQTDRAQQVCSRHARLSWRDCENVKSLQFKEESCVRASTIGVGVGPVGAIETEAGGVAVVSWRVWEC